MNMTPCTSCRGLVPETTSTCPHCDAPVARRPLMKRMAQTTVGSAFAMTLMACYGAPGGEYDYDDDDEPTTTALGTACDDATLLAGGEGEIAIAADTTAGDESLVDSACGYAPGPERIFYYQPETVGTQAGEVVITSNLDQEHAIYVVDECYDSAPVLACDATALGNGELRFSVSRLEPFYLIVDSTREGLGGDFQVEVRFEPTPVP